MRESPGVIREVHHALRCGSVRSSAAISHHIRPVLEADTPSIDWLRALLGDDPMVPRDQSGPLGAGRRRPGRPGPQRRHRRPGAGTPSPVPWETSASLIRRYPDWGRLPAVYAGRRVMLEVQWPEAHTPASVLVAVPPIRHRRSETGSRGDLGDARSHRPSGRCGPGPGSADHVVHHWTPSSRGSRTANRPADGVWRHGSRPPPAPAGHPPARGGAPDGTGRRQHERPDRQGTSPKGGRASGRNSSIRTRVGWVTGHQPCSRRIARPSPRAWTGTWIRGPGCSASPRTTTGPRGRAASWVVVTVPGSRRTLASAKRTCIAADMVTNLSGMMLPCSSPVRPRAHPSSRG